MQQMKLNKDLSEGTVHEQNIKLGEKANEPENQRDESMNENAIADIHKESEACRSTRGWGFGKANGICSWPICVA